ncbi:D-alanyl-D-alanine carboxypeptidase [Aquibium carbonis]|uniref:D-alanyl-D-alanine carboxypeptidase n=1 Tax=Aquibium carbonis TaxID=2495581 RepID=A0A3R9ZSI3_9HYPH|nr:D-alanyl-D-alanine carboxypeptidase [Aquibium carbonis]RST86657.1 D-alanyl-D-alanine carboxypeptidase [Aquibium carbonis]
MRQSNGLPRSLSLVPKFILVAALAAITALSTVPARAVEYAGIVIDAHTGKTLYAASADAARYPASLTKMMTLYMIFEALDGGRIRKDTRVPFSAHAAARPPTKIGVRAGNSVTVETVIYSLVTKSANDAASAVAELLGGTEAGFARQMTAKARQLGMANTTFQNASGLPDPNQRTTARDMAILGIALREHFPHHYDYFSTRSYTLGTTRMGNHNKLLGRVKGVDGIKTGYIRASGFNLVSSVKTDGRSIVAVVIGGRTGASRDEQMTKLIREYLPKASTRSSGPLIASRVINRGAPVATAAISLPKVAIPTPDFRPDGEAVAAYAPEPAAMATAAVAGAAIETVSPGVGVDPVRTASIIATGGWVVQVASTPSKEQALAVLESTSSRAGNILSNALPFTELFELKGTVFHRARYGGFTTKTAAFDACSALKRKKIDCYAVQQ